MGSVLRERYISRRIKTNIYITIIQPVVLFGCETWTLADKSAGTFMSCERKILRRIYGPVCVNGPRRIRSDRELVILYCHDCSVRDL
jgi:hypothetical protein